MSIFSRPHPSFALALTALMTITAAACNRNDRANGILINTAMAASAPRPVAARAQGQDTLLARLDQGRIKGSPNAKVWMIVVSDFQCPYCKEWHDASFAELERDYVETGKVRLAYITFPLRMHLNARPAAEVALCAGVQGKFWEMHDVLFATQDLWGNRTPAIPVLDSLAGAHGVDVHALDACLATKDPGVRVDADYDRGIKAQVGSTPTVFIGSEKLEGVQPTANYRRALDSALAAAK